MSPTRVIFILAVVLIVLPNRVGTVNTTVPTNIQPSLSVQYFSKEQLAPLSKRLKKRLNMNGYRGTALVAYKDQIIVQYANGCADYATKEKISIHSVFQLASVSKSFTATLIMKLKEDGYLNYDDKVIKYIPEFPYENITIRQLLHHTSGLQNYMYLIDKNFDRDEMATNEDVLNLLIKHKLPLNNWPGKRFIYSNTGYAILALVVERVCNCSFADYLKRHIFDVVGMHSTYTFNTFVRDSLSIKTIGYKRKRGRYFPYNYEPNDFVLGDKGIFSCAKDLFKYQNALNSGLIVSENTLKEAYIRGQTTSRYKKTFNYGFGWRINNDEKSKLVYHNGLWHGFTSSLSRDLEHEITVILLSNTTAPIATIKNDLISITIEEIASLNDDPVKTISEISN